MIEKESREIRPRRGGVRPGAGRPVNVPNRLTRDLKELAAHYGPDALATLVTIMSHGESETARIAAAKELLDRGFGRPAAGKGEEEEKITVTVCGHYDATPERHAVILPEKRPALEDNSREEG